MTNRFLTIAAVASCIISASCYPYNEHTYRQQQLKKQQELQKQKAEKEKVAKKQEVVKKKAPAQTEYRKKTTTPTETVKKTTPTPPNNVENETPKPTPPKRPTYDYATKVPGKPGHVFSPYNNKVIDVRDIPSGTVVRDPTYPAAEKKFFRVP